MLVSTVIMGALAFVLFLIAYFKGGNSHITGMKSAVSMTVEVTPLILLAFIVAGLIQVVMPAELLSKWIGAESGVRGIIFGSLAGCILPGGPAVNMPVAAILIKSGAHVGTVVAFLTSWSLLSISRLPLEVGILGWKVALVRMSCTFFFPPIAGFLAYVFFE